MYASDSGLVEKLEKAASASKYEQPTRDINKWPAREVNSWPIRENNKVQEVP